MEIGPARAGDAPAVAGLHARLIDEGFVSTLGPDFLTLLYRAMAASANAVLLVARDADEGAVAGFAAGSVKPDEFFHEFRKQKSMAAARAVAARAIRPRVARGLVETLRHMRRSPEESAGAAELFAIAVAPDGRRRGTGMQLERALEGRLRAAGAARLEVTVGSDNTGAQAFYERCGFTRAREVVVHRGTRSLVYVSSLEGS